MHNPGQMQILQQQRGQPRLTQTVLSEPASLTDVPAATPMVVAGWTPEDSGPKGTFAALNV